ncbi:hypothetical protein [Pengzhenrongella sp.]|uniref:hypothetical protein n=1 Tax=Pengzhenrongella sp. TaxID=2888820 RepID=UPI002F95E979
MIWAVLAPVIRWPLRSPWRLIGVIVVVILGVNAAGALNSSGGGPPARATESPTTANSTPGNATPTPSGSPPPARAAHDEIGNSDALSGDPAATNDSVAAAQAAAQFVAAWARPDLSATAWHAAVRPLVTPKFYTALQTTDPANIPAATVSGQPVQVALNKEAGVFDVPTRSTYVRVFVELHAQTWLATDVQPTN